MNIIDQLLIERGLVKASNLSVLTEEEKAEMSDKVVSKLYKSVKKKALSANFSEIDSSKGDFTKLKNHNDIVNAIKYLNKIASKGQEGSDLKSVIPTLEGVISLLNSNKSAFQKAYSSKNLLGKYIYESACIGLIQVTSHAVSEAVTYVNVGTYIESKPAKPKNLLKNNSLKALAKLVEMQKSNKLSSVINNVESIHEECIAYNISYLENELFEDLNEAKTLSQYGSEFLDVLNKKGGEAVETVGKIGGFVKGNIGILKKIGTIVAVLSLIRPCIYIFVCSRIKLSQYLDQLADFVELNSASITDKDIKQKQEKWVERLRKMAQKISTDQSVASNRAEEEMKDDDNNYESSNESDDLGIM